MPELRQGAGPKGCTGRDRGGLMLLASAIACDLSIGVDEVRLSLHSGSDYRSRDEPKRMSMGIFLCSYS